MSFAIIAHSNRQYLVKLNSELMLAGHLGQVGDTLTAPILLLQDSDQTSIGQPHLPQQARLKVMAHTQGDKLHVRTYKAKSRSRRHLGYRDHLTQAVVVSLGTPLPAPKPKSASPKTAAKKTSTPKKTTPKPKRQQGQTPQK